jgi:hypothetical protein
MTTPSLVWTNVNKDTIFPVVLTHDGKILYGAAIDGGAGRNGVVFSLTPPASPAGV